MIKITPKISPDENEIKHKWGYELMRGVFNDLVFYGKHAGLVKEGTKTVTIDTDADTVRRSILDIWMACKGIDAEPDEILKIEHVHGRLV